MFLTGPPDGGNPKSAFGVMRKRGATTRLLQAKGRKTTGGGEVAGAASCDCREKDKSGSAEVGSREEIRQRPAGFKVVPRRWALASASKKVGLDKLKTPFLKICVEFPENLN